jgi:hypothetical protein
MILKPAGVDALEENLALLRSMVAPSQPAAEAAVVMEAAVPGDGPVLDLGSSNESASSGNISAADAATGSLRVRDLRKRNPPALGKIAGQDTAPAPRKKLRRTVTKNSSPGSAEPELDSEAVPNTVKEWDASKACFIQETPRPKAAISKDMQRDVPVLSLGNVVLLVLFVKSSFEDPAILKYLRTAGIIQVILFFEIFFRKG